MPTSAVLASPDTRTAELTAEECGQKALITRYLLDHEPEFVRLYKLQQAGWKRKSGDTFFQRRRKEADTADEKLCWKFYSMMKGIGFEMNNATGALSLGGDNGSCMQVLDLCVAPGGYSAAVLDLNPTASIDAISLPNHDGGHRVLIPFGRRDPRVQILFTDITMLATEYGVDLNNIPIGHPDAGKFKLYDPTRANNTILCFAMGKFCVPKNARPTASAFATIKLFKPAKAHAIRSSFYMVAKNIQPQDTKAKLALERYRKLWHRATFGCDRELGGDEITEDTAAVLEEFGPRLVELGREIWRVQADALEKAPFMQNGMSGGEGEAVGEAVRLEPSHLPSP